MCIRDREHIAQIYYRDNIRIVAVVDADEQKARLFAMKYGADRYGIDYHEFITRDDVDIVIIATYVSTHLSILRDCVVAGKMCIRDSLITKKGLV